VSVNCATLPAGLVESELFGHVKGAFSGATGDRLGRFQAANGGTLFLDEVGELPPDVQAKLLRVLQESTFEPVGSDRTVQVDVRIVAATNLDIARAVKEGRFREDLFYRLHVFPITVPPLCERPEDIAELVRHFLARFGAEEGKRIRAISAEALALLAAYRWPGNVRQLENAVFRAVVMAEDDSIGIDEFPQIAAQIGGPTATVPASEGFTEALRAPSMIDVPPLADFGVAPSSPSMHGALALLDHHGDVRPLEEIEAEVIRSAIAHYRGQMSEVARRLQIGRSTLYRKLENLGLAERAPEGRKDERKEPAEAH